MNTSNVESFMKHILTTKIFSHLLINQVGVVAMGERGLHFDHLTSHLNNRGDGQIQKHMDEEGLHLFPDGVDVRVFALPPSLP